MHASMIISPCIAVGIGGLIVVLSFMFVCFSCYVTCLKHSNKQTIDVSYNAIADLSPLAALPFLQELNASHNSLTDVLAYRVFQNRDFRCVHELAAAI